MIMERIIMESMEPKAATETQSLTTKIMTPTRLESTLALE